MGPESENKYVVYSDGEPVEHIGTLPEITLAAGAPEPESVFMPMPEITMYLKARPWNCRSRKRFIKLMMSEGLSRNDAELLAYAARMMRIPYSEAWRKYILCKEHS